MIIWITPKWPLPATDGARIATTQLLREITSRGLPVHLCSLVPEAEVGQADAEQAKRELGVTSVTIFQRRAPRRFRQLLNLFLRPGFPITLAPFATNELRETMHGFLAGRHFDLVVYDGLHAGGWSLGEKPGSELLKLVEGREVYRAHNVESEIWFAGARESRNLLRRWLLKFQGWLVREVETRLLLRASYTFPVSFDDERKFSLHQPSGKLKTLPIGVRVPLPMRVDREATALGRLSTGAGNRRLLFVGKLDWPPNRDGLRWLLDKVWLHAVARAPDLKLTVVGSGERAWLDAYRGFPGLEIVGRVEDLCPYYENCIASLIPVFYGSGVRVKAIESSLFGRVSISTRLGVEGMGLTPDEHYVRAETIDEWIQALTSLDPATALEMGRLTREHAQRVFDPEAVAKTFVETVGLDKAGEVYAH